MNSPLDEVLAVNPAALEETYRSRELFQGYRVEPPFALRLDGVGWGHRLEGFTQPRDLRVHRALVHAVMEVLRLLGGCCGYVVSDEANIVFLDEAPYGGRVEKLASISAAIASATVSLELGRRLFLDSRVVKLYSKRDAYRYLLYRARVGFNNYVSTLYHQHLGSKKYTPPLHVMLHELREKTDLDPLKGPHWRSLGSCIAYLEAERQSNNTMALRRRIAAMDGLELCRKKLLENEGKE
ncbi:tRNA(His) guanylyltransferase Thg1 family protein [Hyperthermus butylicus]|uniref:Conserved archaeal protein n=1 Tax=Hyperthermus butylicus (strain DSM 5456 / JCM 9403 / PLM1-5) TaxID=415426 RepID=A2BLN1_HYPBU|nr:tRNA(His) guanylyltransferase Thg1 family protein [Hyperthermus butylicus]ABM80892.1 conserved archaeal protein [Hyperthermus butylicus DSM 5456]